MSSSRWSDNVTPIRGGIEPSSNEELDEKHELPQAEPMTDTTDYRQELKLRDDQLRREMDLRQESFRAEQAVRDKALDDRFQGFLSVQAERDKRMEGAFNHIDASHTEIKSSISSMKNTMIVTAVTAVITIVLGIAAFNATLTSNMLSAFQAGKPESAVQAAPALATPAKEPTQPEALSPPKK